MKFIITTVSLNRVTRAQHAPPRTELIDTETSEIFTDAVTPLDVECKYEAFHNDPAHDLTDEGLTNKLVLKVIGVEGVSPQEAWVYEAAQALLLDPKELTLAVRHELTLRVAGRIAAQVEQAANPNAGWVTF